MRTNAPARLTRRRFLRDCSLASGALCSLGARRFFALDASSTTVRTPAGTLRGASINGARVFVGIPFAQPPLGPLRFRPPVKPAAWTGERDATRFPDSPMQWREQGPLVPHSEDCLYLNIWAPQGKGPFPVFVWIHGGGFTNGHAYDATFDGTGFARENIVSVSVEYRLGVFGFLDFGPLLGAGYSGSANNALRDLIAALTWVQDNIASFGGDPSRVTIGGESAGAKLTDILMGVPAAEPLFHQMISESGGAERVWPRSNAETVARGFADAFRSTSGKSVDDLRTAPPDLLIDAQHALLEDWPQHFPLRAEVDGTLLPRLPIETIAAGSTRGKRLLIGTNRDESATFVGPHPSSDAAAKDLGNLRLEDFAPVFRRYRSVYPSLSEEQLRIRALTAEEYWIPSLRVVDAHVGSHVGGGGTAWMYRLDFAETSGRLQGYAYHSLDVGLVWNKPHLNVANAEAEAALARQVHEAWASFIRGETPHAEGLPTWPPYQPNTRPTMILNTQSHIEQQPAEAELRLWDKIL
jgi:para-nitrobenzyl esterase